MNRAMYVYTAGRSNLTCSVVVIGAKTLSKVKPLESEDSSRAIDDEGATEQVSYRQHSLLWLTFSLLRSPPTTSSGRIRTQTCRWFLTGERYPLPAMQMPSLRWHSHLCLKRRIQIKALSQEGMLKGGRAQASRIPSVDTKGDSCAAGWSDRTCTAALSLALPVFPW